MMKKMNKKLHAWAKAEKCHVWELTHSKKFWQFVEPNGSYKMTDGFMVTFNGLMIMSKTAFEVFDAELKSTVFVTTHGVVNIEPNKGDWQMLRR